MAQSGYTPISLYYTTTAAAVPTSGNLVAGELALNTNDGKLYYKNSSGVVTLLAGATAGPAGGSNTQIQFNSSGALAGSSNLTWNGTTLAVTGAATVSTTLGITGTTTAAAINASGLVAMAGAATVGTTLGVTGLSTLGTDGLLSLTTKGYFNSRYAAANSLWQWGPGTVSTGNAFGFTVGGTNVLDLLSGGIAVTGTLAVGGTTTAAAINASGLVAMAGAATVGTTLGVTGASTFTGSLFPNTDLSADMGSAATRFDTLYIRRLSVGTGADPGINNAGISGTLGVTGAVGIGATPLLTDGKLLVAAAGNVGLTLRQNTTANRFQLFVGDGTAGTAADDNYIRNYNTSLHIQAGAVGTTEVLTISSAGAVTIPGTLGVTGITTTGWVQKPIGYTAADTTPSVLNASFMSISNSSPISITALDDGVTGQIVTLFFNDANTTITRNNAYLSGGVNFVSSANDTLTLLNIGSNIWVEVARGVNA